MSGGKVTLGRLRGQSSAMLWPLPNTTLQVNCRENAKANVIYGLCHE